jgi:hypothetical protein
VQTGITAWTAPSWPDQARAFAENCLAGGSLTALSSHQFLYKDVINLYNVVTV